MWRLGAIVIGATLLAGCGTQGSLPIAPVPSDEPPAQVIGVPTPGVGNPGEDPNARRLLQAMAQAQSALQTATCEAVMYCRGGQGNRPKALPDLGGEWEATTTYKQIFKKTERYRIEVTQCSNPNSVGMKMLVQGNRAQVKLPGLLSVLPISKGLGDKEMLNFRGHRLDAGSLGGLARRFGSGDPQARFVGEQVVDGVALDMVEIPHAPSFDRTIVKEVLGFDRQTHLPRYHAMHTAKRKVYELKLRNLKINAPVADSKLEL
jgi:hypothetical protein